MADTQRLQCEDRLGALIARDHGYGYTRRVQRTKERGQVCGWGEKGGVWRRGQRGHQGALCHRLGLVPGQRGLGVTVENRRHHCADFGIGCGGKGAVGGEAACNRIVAQRGVQFPTHSGWVSHCCGCRVNPRQINDPPYRIEFDEGTVFVENDKIGVKGRRAEKNGGHGGLSSV